MALDCFSILLAQRAFVTDTQAVVANDSQTPPQDRSKVQEVNEKQQISNFFHWILERSLETNSFLWKAFTNRFCIKFPYTNGKKRNPGQIPRSSLEI
jgi:hypothetical protein